MKHMKKYNESILGNLMDSTRGRDKTDMYTYLGDTNSGEWYGNLENILKDKKYSIMLQSDIEDISKMFKRKRGRSKDEDNPVIYPKLKRVQNSRFGHCWFLGKEDGNHYMTVMSWDICIQYYDDEWYLVNIGSGDGSFNYWYICDQFHGLEQLIKDKLLK